MVLNEGEITWPAFLADLSAGAKTKPVYETEAKPDITKTPCPRFDLVNLANYAMISLQYSRGCPFQCEFCDIHVLYGRIPRTKTAEQMLAELDALYRTGYRGGVFVVDDNFIGNRREVVKFLPELERWNREHGNPFQYGTEATLNLAEDKRLLRQLTASGFLWVFIGIETPEKEALKETHKHQNVNGSLVDRVRELQSAGLLVFGGFIVGFDNEEEDIFDRQITFITQSAIPNAMVGQLGALPKTPLLARMEREGRLIRSLTDETGLGPFFSNFRTKLPFETLLRGQMRILQTIYEPRAYFERLLDAYRRMPRQRGFLKRAKRVLSPSRMLLGGGTQSSVKALPQLTNRARFVALLRMLRAVEPVFRREALRFIGKMLRSRPEYLQQSLDYLVPGYHYFRFTRDSVLPEYADILSRLPTIKVDLAPIPNSPQLVRITTA